MSVEIERKFLVDIARWHASGIDREHGNRLRQGYLSTEPVVRVRMSDAQAWITIKGRNVGIVRAEFEYEIPLDDARELFALCGDRVLDKTRFTLEYRGQTWEVDEFHGVNDGLVTAEIEMEAVDAPFEKPEWVGLDVSEDPRYTNSALAGNPFSAWT